MTQIERSQTSKGYKPPFKAIETKYDAYRTAREYRF